MKIKTSVSLSEKALKTLRQKAKAERRSVSQVIELFVEDALPAVTTELKRKTTRVV